MVAISSKLHVFGNVRTVVMLLMLVAEVYTGTSAAYGLSRAVADNCASNIVISN